MRSAPRTISFSHQSTVLALEPDIYTGLEIQYRMSNKREFYKPLREIPGRKPFMASNQTVQASNADYRADQVVREIGQEPDWEPFSEQG